MLPVCKKVFERGNQEICPFPCSFVSVKCFTLLVLKATEIYCRRKRRTLRSNYRRRQFVALNRAPRELMFVVCTLFFFFFTIPLKLDEVI
jgi:uncharacterized membrane protein